MICDLVSSTSLADRSDPEDLNETFGIFYAAVTESVSEFGGFVAHFKGDGALGCFGYPAAHEDDAERAIQAAFAMLERLKAGNPRGRPLSVRVGIATGNVAVGDLHAKTLPTTLDIVGRPAHLASRLQAIARPDSIFVDAGTRNLVRDLFHCHELGPIELKDLKEPVVVWEAVAQRSVSSRFEALRGVPLTPMLARDAEHATLLADWRRAATGHGLAVLVRGEAGIGKSRLAASITEEVVRSHGRVLRFGCSPTREGSAFHPCIAFLEQAAGYTRASPDEIKLQKLAAALVDASDADLSLVAELMSIRHAAPASLANISPRARRQRTMQALLAQLERSARAQPTLIVFEDAQWSDESSRILLERLVDRLQGLPIMLLVTARPKFRPRWTTHRPTRTIELGPLTKDLSEVLVHFIAKDHPLASRIVSAIVAQTDGVPLFIEEVTKAFVEKARSGASDDSGSSRNELLPFTLKASLRARLDPLDKRAGDVAQIASVIGREFSSDLLRLVCDTNGDMDSLLEALVASEILLPPANGSSSYVFKHALIRDEAYAIMSRAMLEAVHIRVASALEMHYPEVARDNAEIIAFHYAEGRVFEKSVDYWLRAGRHCLRRSAMDEALSHLRRGERETAGVSDLPRRHQVELDLAIAIGMAQIATQGYAVPSTGDTFRKAQALCDLLPDPPQTLAVMHGLWTHALMRADFPTALRQVEEVLDRGATRSDSIWTLMGYRFRGSTHYFLGRFAEAIADIDAGLAQYDPALRARYATVTVDDPRIVMLLYRAWCLMCMGSFAEARRCSEVAVAEARKIGHLYSLAHALSGRAFITLTTGSPIVALAQIDELTEALSDNGIAYYDAIATIMRGYALTGAGNSQQGLALVDSGLAAYRGAGTILYVSGFLRMAAECRCRAGMPTEAMALIDEAVTIMDATWQCWDAAEIHRVRGMVLLSMHSDAEAETCFRRSLAVARSQGAWLWELRAARDLASLLARNGAGSEGRNLLDDLSRSDAELMPVDSDIARGILFADAPGNGR